MCKLHILLLSQVVSVFLTRECTDLFHKPVCILNSSVNDLLNSLWVTFITMTCVALKATIQRSKVCIGPSGPIDIYCTIQPVERLKQLASLNKLEFSHFKAIMSDEVYRTRTSCVINTQKQSEGLRPLRS